MLPPRKFLLLTMGVISPWSSDDELSEQIKWDITWGRSFNNKNCEKAQNLSTPETKEDLKRAIQFGVRVHGNKADLRWINASRFPDMSYLFIGSKFTGIMPEWGTAKSKE